MSNKGPVDYQEALDQFRHEEQSEKNRIHDPDYIPIQSEEPVDYLAISKAWDKEQEGKYKIHLQAGKRNPSHDPVYREPICSNQ